MFTHDILDPFQVTESYKAEALEIKQPTGRNANRVFQMVSAMMPVTRGQFPENLADLVIDFVNDFAEFPGCPTPVSAASGSIGARDVMALAEAICENFTPPEPVKPTKGQSKKG